MTTNQIAYRRDDAARALGVSVDTLDRLISRGEIRSARVGSARIVPAAELQSYLERQVDAATA